MDEVTQSADQSELGLPLPPGSFGLPMIGETLRFINDPDFADKQYEKYGSVCKTHLFGSPVIMLMGADANRFVLANENKYFSLPFSDNMLGLLGPDSLLQMKEDKEHQRQRKLLRQAFQPRVMTVYVSHMEEITRKYLHKWEGMGKLIWYLELKKYTFELICKVVLGIDAVAASHFNELFEQWIDSIGAISGESTVTGIVRGLHFREQLLLKIEEIISQRQHQLDSPEDFLGLLLQVQNRGGDCLSFPELRDTLLDLILGGQSLTFALTSLCLSLAQNPSVLAKAHVEQQQWSGEEPLTIAHLDQMHYLDQIVKEALRVSVRLGSYRKVIQTCSFNGWQIPKGWLLVNRIGLMHQDGNIGAEPKQFNPERFSPENKIQPFNFLPFGGGARECPGKNLSMLTMKLFAARLIRAYRWELLPEQDLGLVMFPFPHLRDGLKVNFYPVNAPK